MGLLRGWYELPSPFELRVFSSTWIWTNDKHKSLAWSTPSILYYRTIDPSKMNSNARKAFRFKLHRGLPDLKDDGIKKINMLIISPPYSSFRHLRRVIVERVNKMTVLSTNDCEARGPVPHISGMHLPGTLSLLFLLVAFQKALHKRDIYMRIILLAPPWPRKYIRWKQSERERENILPRWNRPSTVDHSRLYKEPSSSATYSKNKLICLMLFN